MRTWLRSSSKALLPAALGLCLAQNASAQSPSFPRNAPFTGPTEDRFTFKGARLTGTGLTGDDPKGFGYLRLTNATQNQAGYVIADDGFDAPEGFTISFEFFAYGGTGADGFSVFLVDEAGQPSTGVRIGATGGSLGYAQKTVDPVAPGVSRGYIGIGIDEFGNFANPTEGRIGGPGLTPDAVSIRGAGDGSSATDYPYITGTGLNQLGFSLDVPTVRAQSGSPDYRRAFIDVVPVGTGATRTYRITVRIQHGTEVSTTVNNVTVSTPPDRLRLGFSGSTGGQTNIHEIRNLNIVQAPFAVDDLAGTIYGQSVALNVINNDIAPGSSINPATVDLNIDQANRQLTRVIDGKGTFTVNPTTGVVTFTPLITFAGVVTIPYTVSDILNQVSSPANITIIVEGADVSTTVSGPTSANPGSRITYTVNTSNLGTQAATNVRPTLQIAPNLPAASVSVTNGTYNESNGLVTFDAIASLASGATNPTVNSVSVIAPVSGSVVATTGYVTTAPAVPDPAVANNTATITTAITGISNVAGVCATPGKDGPITLTSTSPTPNTYFPGTASTTTNATSITLGQSVGSNAPITAGDLLLVMQMQGAEINTLNTNAYGSNTAAGSGNLGTNYTAGLYEYVTAQNDVPATGGTVQLTTSLSRIYTNADFSTTGTGGQQRFQVIRVPQYSSLTINGTVTGTAWNGSAGGVLVIDVAGKTTFSGTSTLTMTGKGFRGGGSAKYTSSSGNANTDYVKNSSQTLVGAHGSKGEGIVGTPRYLANNGAVSYNATTLAASVEGYNGGSVGRGAPGNAGGGGSDGNPNSNDRNTGGGGGSNGGAGGNGGTYNATKSNTSATGGIGGSVVGSASASRIVMGGGGGAGSTNTNNTADIPQSNGGNGGGIIIFRTGSVENAGTLQANGTGGSAVANSTTAGTASNNGAGGGGAGGTVLVSVQSAGIANITVQANGGDGGNSTSGTNNIQFGSGGGGGGGNIFANGNLNNASTKARGTNGNSRDSNDTPAANGAGPGFASTASNNTGIPSAYASAGACLPTFDVELSTSTRNVARQADRSVSPATYTLVVSNLGGSASSVSSLVSLTSNIFAYDPAFTPVATLQLANESGNVGNKTAATNLAITAPTTATSTPTFGIGSIPAGATVSITFRATVASTAVDNFPYQADATVTYLDPTRTTTAQRVGPSTAYASGGATAGGSNYGASSSSREDVIVARPLPVELKRFDVAAKGLNAELAWATASELQNDHFNIERSLDGKNFEQVGTVKGQGASSKEVAYRYTDAGAGRLSLKPIYYRLQQVDLDGSNSYSPIRIVKFERGTKAAIALYPNPHQGTATLDLTALSSLDSQVEVMDISGRVVGKFQLLGGLQHPLDLNALPLGSYLIRVRNAETVVTLPMIRN